jgi:CRISPR/Cas system-associated exonuclease Cas4 (RecB family)
MPVPETFQFSQNNLQDYIECPRRFQLRHLLKQKWPGLQSEPVMEQEYRMQQGQLFHQMVFQHQSSIPQTALVPSPANPDLCRWWDHYLMHPPRDLPFLRLPEFSLSAPFAGYRMIAKYDLLAVDAGKRIVIIDWKTSRKRPPRHVLEQKMQTRLYRMLAVLAGCRVNSGLEVIPEQVQMIYWFAEEPDRPEYFPYDTDQFEADRREVSRLIGQITSTMESVWYSTVKDRSCQFCNYRSLCCRGVRAGNYDEMEDEGEEDLSDLSSFRFDQAGDLPF